MRNENCKISNVTVQGKLNSFNMGFTHRLSIKLTTHAAEYRRRGGFDTATKL